MSITFVITRSSFSVAQKFLKRIRFHLTDPANAFFESNFAGIVIAATTRKNPKINMATDVIICRLVVIAYKDAKIKKTELTAKSLDNKIAKAFFLQKNCPIRQMNKTKKKQKQSLSNACRNMTACLVLMSISKNPNGIIKAISCQKIKTVFSDIGFIFYCIISSFAFHIMPDAPGTHLGRSILSS